MTYFTAPPPPVPEDPPAAEEPFELPTLEEVARTTGTLHSEPLGRLGEQNTFSHALYF